MALYRAPPLLTYKCEMASLQLIVLFVLCAFCSCFVGDYSDLTACKYIDDKGKVYDLSLLSRGLAVATYCY